jgi:hypothetical protein
MQEGSGWKFRAHPRLYGPLRTQSLKKDPTGSAPSRCSQIPLTPNRLPSILTVPKSEFLSGISGQIIGAQKE